MNTTDSRRRVGIGEAVGYWVAIAPSEPFARSELLAMSDLFDKEDLHSALDCLINCGRVRRVGDRYVPVRPVGSNR